MATATSAPGRRSAGRGAHALAANARRNAAGGARRWWRWRTSRDAAWRLLERHVGPGAAVAVVGAGNGHDLPLARLGRRAGRLDLIDLDARALGRARRRLRLAGVRAATYVEDVTDGDADAIIRHARTGRPPGTGRRPQPPALAAAPYDVVIADLFLSQLLFPALTDARLDGRRVERTLLDHGQGLTNAVVARLAAAAPGGTVICLEDLLGWWAGHPQPVTLAELLALAANDPGRALRRALDGRRARGCDGRAALAALGAEVLERAFWRWPFAPGTDYLVCATVARAPAAGS